MEEVKRDIESFRDIHFSISANISDEIEEIQKGIAQIRLETKQAHSQLQDAMKSIRGALDKEEAKLQQQITSYENKEISALQHIIAQNETRRSECDSRYVQCGRILNTNIREMMQFLKSMPQRLSQLNKWNKSTPPLCLTPGTIDATRLARMIAIVSNTGEKKPDKSESPRSPRRNAKKSDFKVNIKQSFLTESTTKSINTLGNGEAFIKHIR